MPQERVTVWLGLQAPSRAMGLGMCVWRSVVLPAQSQEHDAYIGQTKLHFSHPR